MENFAFCAMINGIVINKKVSKLSKLFVSQVIFFPLKFVGIAFVSFINSSHGITECSIVLAKYLPFLQLRAAGFQIYITIAWHMLC